MDIFNQQQKAQSRIICLSTQWEKENFIEFQLNLFLKAIKFKFDNQFLRSSGLSYSFTIENSMLSLIQAGDLYELRINNQVFSHIMNQSRIKSEFQFDDNKYKSAAPPKKDYDDYYPSKPVHVQKEKKTTPEEDDTDFGFNKYDYNNAKKDLKQNAPSEQNQQAIQFKMASSTKRETEGSDFKQFPGFSNLDNFGFAASKSKTFQPNSNFNFNEFNFGFQDQKGQQPEQQAQLQQQQDFLEDPQDNQLSKQLEAQQQFQEVVREQESKQKQQQLIDLLDDDNDDDNGNIQPNAQLPDIIMQPQIQQQQQIQNQQQNQYQPQFDQQQQQVTNQLPYQLQQPLITQSMQVNQQLPNMYQQQAISYQQPKFQMQNSIQQTQPNLTTSQQPQQLDMFSLYYDQSQPQQQPQQPQYPQYQSQMQQPPMINQTYGMNNNMVQSIITSQNPMQQQQFYSSIQPQQFQTPTQPPQSTFQYTMKPTNLFEENKQKDQQTPFDLLF